MAVQVIGAIKIKRRPAGGAVGAPSALLSGEIAHNDADDTVYYGFGDDGSGNATSVKAVGGSGTFATKQYVSDAMAGAGAGTVTSVALSGPTGVSVTGSPVTSTGTLTFAWATGYQGYTTAEANKLAAIDDGANNYVHPTTDGNRHIPATASGDVNKFLRAGATAGSASVWFTLPAAAVSGSYNDLTNKPTLGSLAAKSAVAISEVTDLTTQLAEKAPLASPALTGTPTAPTAATSTNTTQIATTAFVKAVIGDLIGGAGSAFDTLKELQDALGGDANFAATVTNSLGEKLAKASNLADLTNAATARTNLGLGSMATQAANNVNITGGSIDGVVFDGGTF